MMDKCYRCDEVISMCPCDESTYTADDEISRLRAEISTAEAFHKVAVAERNYERQRADILESATIKALEDRDRLRAELAEYRTALEQIVAPFEDLNFVSGNKLLTYIHDVATAALAAKGGE